MANGRSPKTRNRGRSGIIGKIKSRPASEMAVAANILYVYGEE